MESMGGESERGSKRPRRGNLTSNQSIEANNLNVAVKQEDVPTDDEN